MSIAPISNDNIRVGYISETDGYVKNKTVAEANEYEKLNPETIFVFVNKLDWIFNRNYMPSRMPVTVPNQSSLG